MKRIKFYGLMVTASWALTGCAPEITSPSSAQDASPVASADVTTPQPDLSLADPVVSAALPIAVVSDQGDVATADLRVPAGYSFNQTFALELAVTNSQGRHGYLSVCSDFSQAAQSFAVDYANCQLRVALEGDFAASLDLANNVTSVIAVVWYFDTNEPADFALWEKDSSAKARFEIVL